MTAKTEENNCCTDWMDRISGLPQNLLHRILCCLSQKQTVQTSVLAKSWLHLWCTRPKLELNVYDFNRYDHRKEKFLHVLNKTLQGYRDQNLGIDELHLWTCGESANIPLLEERIPIVMRDMGVKELVLGVYMEKSTYFDLPGSLFQSESLQKLSLRGWNLDSNCSVVLLKHLQKLVLDDVYVSDKTFEKMMLGCPLIEYVKLEDCAGLTRIKLNEAPNLNHFEFSSQRLYYSSDECSIEIDAPSVESISISCSWKCFHTHKHLGRLKTLNLQKVALAGESFFHSFSSELPCVEELVLVSCSGRLEKINLSSLSLKRLVIKDMVKILKAAFDTPNIVEFVYKGHISQSISFTTTTSDLYVGRLKTLNLEKVALTDEFFQCFSSKFPCIEKLVLVSCSGHLKKINLSSLSLKRLVIKDIVMKDFNAALDTPNIKELVYAGHIPQSISFTTTITSDRWVSKLHLGLYLGSDCDASSCFLKLHQLLGALSQSEIRLYFIGELGTHPLINIDGGFNCKPVAVEHLQLKFKFQSYSSFSDFIKALFSVCRPRQICRCWSREGDYSKEYKQVTNFLYKILYLDHGKEEEDKISWQRDIEEVGLFQTFGDGDKEKHPVEIYWIQYAAALLPNYCFDPHKLYFILKWKEIDSLTN